MSSRLTLLVTSGILCFSSLGFGQLPDATTASKTYGGFVPDGIKKGSRIGQVDFKTGIGSFKILSPGDIKSFGKIEITFSGSILLVGFKGKVTPGPTMIKEYENKKYERQVFSGKGKMIIEGEWTAVQFFGKDMSAKWEGMGICRVYGEFDKNLETGTYFVKGDKERPWMQGGMQFVIPLSAEKVAKPRVKKADG